MVRPSLRLSWRQRSRRLPKPGAEWSLATAGTGGLILWPLFGATNQLLAGLGVFGGDVLSVATEIAGLVRGDSDVVHVGDAGLGDAGRAAALDQPVAAGRRHDSQH